MAPARQQPPFERTLRVVLGVSIAFGCATQVNTLEPLDEREPNGSSGATASKGGSSFASAGSGSGGKPSTGGTAINAFGGSAVSGGNAGSANSMGGRGGAGGGGGGGQGGTAQAGTAQGGSSAGTAGRGGAGGGGSGSGGSGNSGGALGSGCLMSWRDNDACDTCTTQTQGDKKACAQVLDCYLQNDCGPATCAGNDDECGANTIQQGTAPYPIAEEVYDCICN
jgi:hypothetical protein